MIGSIGRASGAAAHVPETRDALICFSHLRWNFVFQRPQHIMGRVAKKYRVFYFEEPIFLDIACPALRISQCAQSGVTVVVPLLPHGLRPSDVDAHLQHLLDGLCNDAGISVPLLWYYTPMMRSFSDHLAAAAIIYDCMDELANFMFAPPSLLTEEQRLLDAADLVFTGGYSLYEAKRDRHPRVHAFPSSIDHAHFAAARRAAEDPADQVGIPHPRLGFFGVIDERMDLGLLALTATERPKYQFVIVGPVVKIDTAQLPQRPNIHYLGAKTYDELPAYMAGWDAALMPFAINAATRFISPTKTPEYLAGGRPVVSTPITDVIRHYGDLDAVHIAATPAAFVAACDNALEQSRKGLGWRDAADEQLAGTSWDRTVDEMLALIDDAIARLAGPQTAAPIQLRGRPAGRGQHVDYLIVGAGFAGSVLAERLAAGSGKRVMLIDRRPHIAGNAFDHHDAAGVLIHKYGPHIFHTNAPAVAEYLSRFTAWRPYEHRVLASVDAQLVPMPINRTTLNQLYGLNLGSDAEAAAFLAARATAVPEIRTAEEAVIASVGRDLYTKFFQGYTRKQWGLDPSDLDKAVTARVPARTSLDDRYFTDTFQNMPLHGYTRMFENMLDHDGIRIELNVDYRDVRRDVTFDHLIFTGPIDEYFDWRYGRLPYRSLAFRHCTIDTETFQPVAVVNYPSPAVPWTRITEYKHMTGQHSGRTSVTYEFPRAEGDPFYPVPKPENQALFKRYEALADATRDVTFVGRLATYRYYNMDQVVGQALATWRRLDGQRSLVGTHDDAASARA